MDTIRLTTTLITQDSKISVLSITNEQNRQKVYAWLKLDYMHISNSLLQFNYSLASILAMKLSRSILVAMPKIIVFNVSLKFDPTGKHLKQKWHKCCLGSVCVAGFDKNVTRQTSAKTFVCVEIETKLLRVYPSIFQLIYTWYAKNSSFEHTSNISLCALPISSTLGKTL